MNASITEANSASPHERRDVPLGADSEGAGELAAGGVDAHSERLAIDLGIQMYVMEPVAHVGLQGVRSTQAPPGDL